MSFELSSMFEMKREILTPATATILQIAKPANARRRRDPTKNIFEQSRYWSWMSDEQQKVIGDIGRVGQVDLMHAKEQQIEY